MRPAKSEPHRNITLVLPVKLLEELRVDAENERRTLSAHIAYLCETQLAAIKS